MLAATLRQQPLRVTLMKVLTDSTSGRSLWLSGGRRPHCDGKQWQEASHFCHNCVTHDCYSVTPGNRHQCRGLLISQQPATTHSHIQAPPSNLALSITLNSSWPWSCATVLAPTTTARLCSTSCCWFHGCQPALCLGQAAYPCLLPSCAAPQFEKLQKLLLAELQKLKVSELTATPARHSQQSCCGSSGWKQPAHNLLSCLCVASCRLMTQITTGQTWLPVCMPLLTRRAPSSRCGCFWASTPSPAPMRSGFTCTHVCAVVHHSVLPCCRCSERCFMHAEHAGGTCCAGSACHSAQ